MITLKQALQAFSLPRLETRLLLQHLCPALTHVFIVAHPEFLLSESQYQAFCQLAERRLQGEPMAYILGAKEFYGREYSVSPAVLIPRPETEHLVEAALDQLGQHAASVLDLGCGSGVIAITLALEAPHWQVSAVELSEAALKVARENAARLGASVRFFHGSWYQPLPDSARFHLIVSNPPYIPAQDSHLSQGDVRFEPRLALTDEQDGLACYREIVQSAPQFLHESGWLMVEHGYDQGASLRELFSRAGFRQVCSLQDLARHERVTLGQYTE